MNGVLLRGTPIEQLIKLKRLKGSGSNDVTLSGSIVSFNSSGITPMQKCEVTLEPIQDLHGQDAPYPAGGGVNKWHLYQNGYYNASGNFVPSESIGCSNKIPVAEGTTYSFGAIKRGSLTIVLRGYYFDSNDAIVGSQIVGNNSTSTTAPTGAVSAALWFAVSGSTDTITQERCDEIGIQFSVGSTLPSAYSPYSNICPITGWTGCEVTRTGKNLLDFDALKTYSNWKEDIATTTGEGGATSSANKGFIIPTKAGYKYTISFDFSNEFPEYLYICKAVGNVGTLIAYLTTNEVRNSSYTFTADDCIHYLRMGATLTEAQFNGQKAKIHSPQLELGQTATDYEPYSGTTLSVTFPDTVYGGSHEFVSGSGNSRFAEYIFTGNESWFESSTPNRFGLNLTNLSLDVATQSTTANSKQNVYSSIFGQFIYKNADNVAYIYVTSSSTNIAINTPLASTAEEIAQLFAGTQLVYELATPTEIPLTPQEISTLAGENNVWSDAGDVTLTAKGITPIE